MVEIIDQRKRTYIGDAVYDHTDGHHIILTTEQANRVHRIALEPSVLADLNKFAESLRAISGDCRMTIISIRNYRAIDRADIVLGGITLIAGDVGYGKTSICTAIAAVLSGRGIVWPDVLKKDSKVLVRRGTDKGSITATGGGSKRTNTGGSARSTIRADRSPRRAMRSLLTRSRQA